MPIPAPTVLAVAHPEPLPAARGHLRVVKLPGWFMVEGDTVDDTTPMPSHPPSFLVQSCLPCI